MSHLPPIDEGLDAIAQSVLDGTADASTIERFHARVAEDDNLRSHFESLRNTFAALDSLDRAESPAEIHRAVMEQVAIGRPPSPVRVANSERWRPRLGRAREWFAFAAGAAAVALLSVMIPSLSNRTEPSLNDAMGTLLLANFDRSATESQAWSWSESWGSGEAVMREESHRTVVSIHFQGTEPTTIALGFDPERFELAEFGAADAVSSARIDRPGALELVLGQQNHVAVVFTPRGSPSGSPDIEIGVLTSRGDVRTRLGSGSSENLSPGTNFDG